MSENPTQSIIAHRYEIIEALGRGGMGKVYRVRDLHTGEEKALKMLRSQWQQHPMAVARFLREMQAVSQLQHEGIIRVYDTHHDEKLLFYTMEYVRGKTLRQWMQQRGKIGFGSTVRVLCLVADALDHAHQVTIHRDLSPENVMVLADGSVRLLDFGLAKLTDPQQALTMVGASLGKMAYIAPEQRVNAATVDHRADLYPLGVMFFEMLAGQLPGPGKQLSALCHELPAGCDAFAAQAMSMDPDKRFQTAMAFRRALLALYTGETPRAAEDIPDLRPGADQAVATPVRTRVLALPHAGGLGFWSRLLRGFRRR
jgi:serine/threonine-protein kinase